MRNDRRVSEVVPIAVKEAAGKTEIRNAIGCVDARKRKVEFTFEGLNGFLSDVRILTLQYFAASAVEIFTVAAPA